MPDKFLGHNIGFLVAVFIAALLQAWARPPQGETIMARSFRRIFGLICGLFMGVYFTAPILVWRNLDADTWELPVGILLAFTGQAIVEFLVELNWKRAVEIVTLWRGK